MTIVIQAVSISETNYKTFKAVDKQTIVQYIQANGTIKFSELVCNLLNDKWKGEMFKGGGRVENTGSFNLTFSGLTCKLEFIASTLCDQNGSCSEYVVKYTCFKFKSDDSCSCCCS